MLPPNWASSRVTFNQTKNVFIQFPASDIIRQHREPVWIWYNSTKPIKQVVHRSYLVGGKSVKLITEHQVLLSMGQVHYISN